MIPGCVQQPRVPFVVAATGPRGMALAAEFGQGWVTFGDPRGPADVPVEQAPTVVRAQMDMLEVACAQQGRDCGQIDKVLLQGITSEQPLASLNAFVDWAGRYQALGITEIVIHWPVPDSVFANDLEVFERIAIGGLAQL